MGRWPGPPCHTNKRMQAGPHRQLELEQSSTRRAVLGRKEWLSPQNQPRHLNTSAPQLLSFLWGSLSEGRGSGISPRIAGNQGIAPPTETS